MRGLPTTMTMNIEVSQTIPAVATVNGHPIPAGDTYTDVVIRTAGEHDWGTVRVTVNGEDFRQADGDVAVRAGDEVRVEPYDKAGVA